MGRRFNRRPVPFFDYRFRRDVASAYRFRVSSRMILSSDPITLRVSL